MRGVARVIGVFALVALTPAGVFAQGVSASITGTVKDASGAVLPGVTVEVSSPALIEKTRSAVTDGTGQYRIVDLRPGTYSVNFTLTGFPPVKREGHRAQRVVHRDGQRRPEGRRRRRNDYGQRRNADRRRAEHAATDDAQRRDHQRDSGGEELGRRSWC